MLTLQYIPYHEFAPLTLDDKLKKVLKSVKLDRIIIIEGRLNPVEESELIKRTMQQIDRKFKGIEIASVDYDFENADLMEKLKKNLAHYLLKRKHVLTIVWPSTIVKEIRRDPGKIQLLTKDIKRRS